MLINQISEIIEKIRWGWAKKSKKKPAIRTSSCGWMRYQLINMIFQAIWLNRSCSPFRISETLFFSMFRKQFYAVGWGIAQSHSVGKQPFGRPKMMTPKKLKSLFSQERESSKYSQQQQTPTTANMQEVDAFEIRGTFDGKEVRTYRDDRGSSNATNSREWIVRGTVSTCIMIWMLAACSESLHMSSSSLSCQNEFWSESLQRISQLVTLDDF